MKKNTIIAFDGAWSHRRRAKECVVTIIDTTQKKVVDYEVVTKTKCGVPGDWEGSANGMELEALKRLLERWVGDENVGGVVHDNDAKASKLIRDLQWKVTEYFDPNHVCKQFETRWNSCPHNNLRGVHAKLLMWFRYLIQCDCSVAEKQALWMNSLEHFKGNHEHCPREHLESLHGPLIKTAKAAAELQHILEETVELLSRALPGLNTQLNESFNSLKAKFGSKDTSWRVSWPSRVDCAVLQMNSETEWRIPLARRCGIHLDQRLIRRMSLNWEREQDIRRKRATPEAQARATRIRWETRQRENQQTAGRNDYQVARPRQHDAIVDQLVPYTDALRLNPGIAVPVEPGDDQVRMVRNRRDIFPPPEPLDPSEPDPDPPDAFAADLPLPEERHPRRCRANHAGSTGPISPTQLTVPHSIPFRTFDGQIFFRHVATSFQDCPWEYYALPHAFRARAARDEVEGDATCDPGDAFSRETGPMSSLAYRNAAIDCHVSPDCDLRSALQAQAALAPSQRLRNAAPLLVEYEDDLDDDDEDDEDLDTDDGVVESLPCRYRVPDDFQESGRMEGKTFVIFAVGRGLT
jgi:hypothetical protein